MRLSSPCVYSRVPCRACVVVVECQCVCRDQLLMTFTRLSTDTVEGLSRARLSVYVSLKVLRGSLTVVPLSLLFLLYRPNC